jgi:hypothetical protein
LKKERENLFQKYFKRLTPMANIIKVFWVQWQLIKAATHQNGNSSNVHRGGNSSNALKGRQLIELFTHDLSHFQ